MRYSDIINESIIRLENGFGEFIVFKNPIKPQVINLFKKIEADEYESDIYAKGFLIHGNLYIWDPWDATHTGVYDLISDDDDDIRDFEFYIKFDGKKFIPLSVMHDQLDNSPGAKLLRQKVKRWNS